MNKDDELQIILSGDFNNKFQFTKCSGTYQLFT